MLFKDFLIEKETKILAAWTDLVLNVYPAETVSFFKKKNDRFANPLGHTLQQGLVELFRALRDDADAKTITSVLERILLVRSLEQYAASQAVSFVLDLKRILREVGIKEVEDLDDVWVSFEKKVDSSALLAFDVYAACRERLFTARINELKSGRYIISDGAVCPSALMRQKKEQPKGLQTMNTQCSRSEVKSP